MKSDLGFKFNNLYHVELIEASTGKVKQSGDFHNIVTAGLWKVLLGGNMAYNIGAALVVGNGSTTPQFSDTKLSSFLWGSLGASEFTASAWPTIYPSVLSLGWLDDYTVQKKVSFTFPATSSYVGSVREIGLGYMFYDGYRNSYNPAIITHALLTDSEGQVITFNKTDLDVLVVTVTLEISLASASDDFTLLRRCKLLEYLIGISNPGSDVVSKFGRLSLIRFNRDKQVAGQIQDKTPNNSTSGASESVTTNDHTGTYTYVSRRLPDTDVTSQTFYNGLAIPNLGYFNLPNEDIFPTYNITDIAIGVGDGSTTAFINPLNYFKEGTEKIYKNGVQLTRGTDYNINHMGNKDGLPEITQMIPIAKASSELDLSGFSSVIHPLVFPVSHVSYSLTSKEARNYDMATDAPAFSASAPLYIEYEEAVTLNAFKCTGGLYGLVYNNTTNTISSNTTFSIDYSTDGVSYVEVASGNTTAKGGVCSLEFPETTAKYWRIRTGFTNGPVGMPQTSAEYQFMLYRKDPYIVFNEAPADGDTITMDVGMDIIMKNSNFIVDVNGVINFTI